MHRNGDESASATLFAWMSSVVFMLSCAHKNDSVALRKKLLLSQLAENRSLCKLLSIQKIFAKKFLIENVFSHWNPRKGPTFEVSTERKKRKRDDPFSRSSSWSASQEERAHKEAEKVVSKCINFPHAVCLSRCLKFTAQFWRLINYAGNWRGRVRR